MKRISIPSFVFGLLLGVFVSGAILLTIRENKNQESDITPINSVSLKEDYTVTTQPSLNESKIDINTASKQTLMTLPGIGQTKADAIIEFRNKYGNFETIDELTYVNGIGSSLFQNIRELICIQSD